MGIGGLFEQYNVCLDLRVWLTLEAVQSQYAFISYSNYISRVVGTSWSVKESVNKVQ